MKQNLLGVITIILLLPLCAFGQTKVEYSNDQIIVKFKSNVNERVRKTPDNNLAFGLTSADRLNDKYNVSKAQRIAFKRSKEALYVLKFAGPFDVQQVIREYEQTGLFDYVEPDYIGYSTGIKNTTLTPNDPFLQRQWGLNNTGTFALANASADADIDATEAWDITTGNSGIIVSFIDTGVELNHPDFAGRIWQNTDEIPANGVDDDSNGFIDDVNGWDFVNNDNDPDDDQGHGTNVAGIFGATGNNGLGYAGVDWKAQIMPLKGLSSTGQGFYSNWIAAINYSVANGADIINMSLSGSPFSQALQDAVTNAFNNGVLVVASMGNLGTATPFYPAALNNVLAVGSTDPDDERSNPFFFSPNSGSNFGPHIDVVAPGNYIYGLDNDPVGNFETFWGGTSQAAPHVTGIASLLLANEPGLSPQQIIDRITTTAEDLVGNPSEDVPGFDQFYGFGRVNAFRALTNPQLDANFTANPTQVCIGQAVVFTDASEINNGAVTYAWNFGQDANPATATGPGPHTVVYNSPGNKTVTLNLNNGEDIETKVNFITVNDSIETSAITGPATVCSGASGVVYFVTAHTGSTYNWQVPPGAVITSGQGTNQIIVDFGETGGTIAVTETSTSACIGGSAQLAITIQDAPITSAITGPATVCSDTTGVVYSVTANPGSVFTWSVPPGAFITNGQGTNTITVNFGNTSGLVTVVQSVAGGCVGDTVTLAVTVEPCGNVNFVADKNFICPNDTVTFTNTSTNVDPATLAWNFGAGANPATATGPGPHEVVYTTTGSKTVSLTGNGETETKQNYIIVGAPAVSAITGPATICQNAQEVAYSVTATTGATYVWTVPPGAVITSGQGTNQILVNFGTTPGNIAVTEILSAGCESTATLPITLTPGPATSAITGPTQICFNTQGVQYSVTVTTGSTYIWTVPTGVTIVSGQGTNTITVNFVTTGGLITVTETGVNGCQGTTVSQLVTVISCGQPDFIFNTVSACIGEPIVFQNTSLGITSDATYEWTFGADANPPTAVGPGPHSVTYSSAGVKEVTLTVTMAGEEMVTQDFVTIFAPPTIANAGPDQEVDFLSATLSANTPLVGQGAWSLVSGTGIIVAPASPVTQVNGLTPGENIFRWTISNGACPPSTDDVSIFVSDFAVLGIVEEARDIINIYPNPFSNQVTIVLSGEKSSSEITVRDVTGRVVYVNEVNEREIQLGDKLLPGIYSVEIVSENRSEVFRISKVK